MSLLDYASILSAGQNLVPNLRQDALADRELDLRQQAFQAKLAEAESEARQRQAYNARLRDFQVDPTPQKAAAMMLDFPDFAEKFKAGWSVLDEAQRRADLTQGSEIFWRANQGDYAGAAAKLRVRVEADRAAGQDVADDEALLAALESGDPRQQKEATGLIALHTRAGDPEAFDKLFPQAAPTDLEKKYQEIKARRGQAYADQWYDEQTQDVVVGQPGAPVYRKSDIIGGTGFQSKGGDPSGSGAGLVATPEQRAETERLEAKYPGLVPIDKGAVAQAVKTGDWSGIFTDPLRGRGGLPVAGGRYGSKRDYGSHTAVDLTGPEGTPVFPAGATGIAKVSNSPRGGNIVTINHGGGLVTRYMHLGQVNVRDGQSVTADTQIGTLGKTGRASGPNLHFELRINGKPVNPSKIGAVRTVRSVQEARKLPSGTVFRTPDGRTMKVPG